MQHEIKLTDEQLVVIHDCLMAGPYGRVAPVVQAISDQLAMKKEQPQTPTDNKAQLA